MSVKNIIWFIPVMIGLYGCPYEANVPLAARPAEAVDTNLVGYWYGIVKDGSDFLALKHLTSALKQIPPIPSFDMAKLLKETSSFRIPPILPATPVLWARSGS